MNNSINWRECKNIRRITVSGPKSLYNKFESREFKNGDWTPAPIEMKVFWRDPL
jgi:hypothetical protein